MLIVGLRSGHDGGGDRQRFDGGNRPAYTGSQTEDKVINLKGESQASNIVGDKGHVSVTSFNRKVLLTGEVPNEAMKQAVGNAISRIDNVESVVNELAILAPSSFTSRSNDAFITGKVSASFVDTKDLFSNSLKTVTERGTVYLMGLVTEREGNRCRTSRRWRQRRTKSGQGF